MKDSASARAGRTKWCRPSQKPCPEPKVGNQPSRTAKTAMQHDRADEGRDGGQAVMDATMARSAMLPRVRAAASAGGEAEHRDHRTGDQDSPRVTGMRSARTSTTSGGTAATGRNLPAGCRRPSTAYCSIGDLSSPYMAVTSATASGLGLRPRSRKLTGPRERGSGRRTPTREETKTVSSSAPMPREAARGPGRAGWPRLLLGANFGRPRVVQVVDRRRGAGDLVVHPQRVRRSRTAAATASPRWRSSAPRPPWRSARRGRCGRPRR